LFQASLDEAGVHLIEGVDFKTWADDVDITADFLGKVDYIITDPPWDILPGVSHDKVPVNMYADIAFYIERLLRPGGEYFTRL